MSLAISPSAISFMLVGSPVVWQTIMVGLMFTSQTVHTALGLRPLALMVRVVPARVAVPLAAGVSFCPISAKLVVSAASPVVTRPITIAPQELPPIAAVYSSSLPPLPLHPILVWFGQIPHPGP